MSSGTTTIAIQDLLNRLAAGDAAAKEQLVDRAIERLTIIARKLLRSFGGERRVELWSVEIVNEAFPKISKAMDDVQPTSVAQFLGLARLQMQRVLLDKVRSLPRHVELVRSEAALDDGEAIGGRADPPPIDLILDLWEAIEQLPERQAETVWFKLAGHTHREIGEFLGVHHDTVDTYWNGACVRLAKKLAPFMADLKSLDGARS